MREIIPIIVVVFLMLLIATAAAPPKGPFLRVECIAGHVVVTDADGQHAVLMTEQRRPALCKEQ